jgi:hypothetical protein
MKLFDKINFTKYNIYAHFSRIYLVKKVKLHTCIVKSLCFHFSCRVCLGVEKQIYVKYIRTKVMIFKK